MYYRTTLNTIQMRYYATKTHFDYNENITNNLSREENVMKMKTQDKIMKIARHQSRPPPRFALTPLANLATICPLSLYSSKM